MSCLCLCYVSRAPWPRQAEKSGSCSEQTRGPCLHPASGLEENFTGDSWRQGNSIAGFLLNCSSSFGGKQARDQWKACRVTDLEPAVGGARGEGCVVSSELHPGEKAEKMHRTGKRESWHLHCLCSWGGIFRMTWRRVSSWQDSTDSSAAGRCSVLPHALCFVKERCCCVAVKQTDQPNRKTYPSG